MSLSQSFFPSDTDDILHPQFTKALKGYSTDGVQEYVLLVRRRLDVLEQTLRAVVEERDGYRSQLSTVKREAYRNAGDRMATLLQSLDQHIEDVRRQAEQDAARIILEATERAESLRHGADEEAQRLRSEAAASLEKAREEADRTLGGLDAQRKSLLDELSSLRQHLLRLLDEMAVIDEGTTDPEPPPSA
jgi:cell division septum initiation protein DivIVA